MKRFFSILFVGSFLMIFSGCGDDSKKIVEEQELTNLKKSSFYIETPNDWEVIPQDQYPQNVLLIKREPSFSDEISSLLAVSVENGIYYSLEKFSDRNLEDIRKHSQDFQKIVREEFLLSSGETAIFVEYSDRYSKTDTRIYFYDVYVMDRKENKSYVVSLLFDPHTSDDHKEFLKNVVKTFSLSHNKE